MCGCLKVMGEKLTQDCEVGADLEISQSVAGEGVRAVDNSVYYIPGKKLTVTILFHKSSVTFYALGLESLVPSGWKYLGLLPGNYNPQVYPNPGTVSDGVKPLEFAWIATTTLPEEFSMSYELEVPEGESSEVSIVSRGLYRLTGGQICTNSETTTFVGPYSGNEGEGISEGSNEGMLEGEGSGEGEIEGSDGREGTGEGETNNYQCGINYDIQCSSTTVQCGSPKGDGKLKVFVPFLDVLILFGLVTLLSSSKKF